MSYYIIVLHRYIPVRATEIIPQYTCDKATKGQIIVLRRDGIVLDKWIVTKGMYNKAVTARIT